MLIITSILILISFRFYYQSKNDRKNSAVTLKKNNFIKIEIEVIINLNFSS